MGFFSFTQEIAIDLGTANTIIMCNDQVVIDEPSVVAINTENKMVAVGRKAQQMIGKGGSMIRTIRPLKDGVITDFYACEMMIRGLIRMIPKQNRWFTPSIRMVVCIPSGSTEVEIRAVRDSSEHAGGRDIYMIYEPMAAAIGIGLDIMSPDGNMVIDIGGGTSEVAVLALGGVVTRKSSKTAGDEFNDNIIDYMRRKHNIAIGETTAERIKINVGSAIEDLENPPEDYEVKGRDLVQGVPMAVKVNYREIAAALDHSISEIEQSVISALECTPPESSADIYNNGIYLAGGGALLRGLDKRISKLTGLQVHVADNPLMAVARGTGIALKNFDKFPFLIK